MVFRTGLLDTEHLSSIQQRYRDNTPYPHIVIEDALQDQFLRQVRDEIIHSLPFNFEENHVYRARRSTNLANISNPEEFSPDLFPKLTRLRDALYSLKFRQWLSRITGSDR